MRKGKQLMKTQSINHYILDITDDELLAMNSSDRVPTQPFITLGYNASNFYFYVPSLHSVIILKALQFKGKFLYRIAPHEYWSKFYASNDKRRTSGINWSHVKYQLIKDTMKIGVFEGMQYMQRDKFLRTKKQQNYQ
jgi:hypothetical protein